MKISLCTLPSPRQNLRPASLSEPQALEGAQLSGGFAGPAGADSPGQPEWLNGLSAALFL